MGLVKRVGEISILGGDFEIDMILLILLCLELKFELYCTWQSPNSGFIDVIDMNHNQPILGGTF